jgi:hypothetical protein
MKLKQGHLYVTQCMLEFVNDFINECRIEILKNESTKIQQRSTVELAQVLTSKGQFNFYIGIVVVVVPLLFIPAFMYLFMYLFIYLFFHSSNNNKNFLNFYID